MNPGVLLAVAAGLLAALPLALQGGLLFALLSPLPLFLVGLSQGLRGAIVAGTTACALNGVMGGLLGALSTLIVLAGPVVLLVRQALLNRPGTDGVLEWYPPGLLVLWLTGVGVVWLVLSAALLGGGPDGIEATVRSDFEEALTVMLPELDAQARSRLSDLMSAFAIGAGPLVWLLLFAVNGILAQGVLQRFDRALRPAPDIRRIELPRWLDIMLAVVLAVAFLGSGDIAYVAQNLSLMLLLPYLFVGLAVVHLWIDRSGGAALLLLMLVYLLLLLGWIAPLVLGLGLIDQLVGLRRRMSAGGPDQEEE